MPKQASDTFTMEAMLKAVDTLRAANAPPCKCPKCGIGYYVAPTRLWKPGDSIRLSCSDDERGCGHVWVIAAHPAFRADDARTFVAEAK
jgi:hypothetical protein